MADLPALPLFIDDFEAATAHLTFEEDGAYNRLMRLCWRQPDCSIPNDDQWIMRKMRCDQATYDRVVKPILIEFFTRTRSRWFQKRLRAEHGYVLSKLDARIKAGRKGGKAKAWKKQGKTHSNATSLLGEISSKPLPPTPTPTPTPTPISSSLRSEDNGGGGGSAQGAEKTDPKPEEQTFRERLLTAIGADPVSGMIGPNGRRLGTKADMIEAGRWIGDLGLTEAECLAEVAAISCTKSDGPPSKFAYFTPALTRLAGVKASPPLENQPPAATQPPAQRRQLWAVDLSKFNDDGSIKA